MKKGSLIQNILDKLFEYKKAENKTQLENFWDNVSDKNIDNKEDIALSKNLGQIFLSINQYEQNKKQNNHLNELLNKLDYSEATNIFKNDKQTVGKVFLKVAAVLIPVAIVSTLLIYYFNSKSESPAYQIVSTQRGSKTKIVLEDGTSIWLNAESELRYPSTFKNQDKRVVNLKGEAYFDVERNEKKPFEVYVSDYKINVLGTSFNVKAYPKQGKIETTLEKGRINIEKVTSGGNEIQKQKITLVPNQTIILYDKNKKYAQEKLNKEKTTESEAGEIEKKQPEDIIIENEDLTQYTAWKENELIFKSKSLGELIPDLERWYDIDITVQGDSLNKIICTANFHNETPEQAIKAICIASKITYEIDKNKVILKAN